MGQSACVPIKHVMARRESANAMVCTHMITCAPCVCVDVFVSACLFVCELVMYKMKNLAVQQHCILASPESNLSSYLGIMWKCTCGTN